MNRRELETLFLTLESTPALLARAAESLSPTAAARKPQPQGFSLLEHVWHLADLEREGYGVRIRRLLTEEDPPLSDFDGERVARERDYQKKDLAQGLDAFRAARTRNLEMLRSTPNSDWKRGGFQESVGRITLEDIPRMMAEHDRGHSREIADLLAHLQGGAPVPQGWPKSAVA